MKCTTFIGICSCSQIYCFQNHLETGGGPYIQMMPPITVTKSFSLWLIFTFHLRDVLTLSRTAWKFRNIWALMKKQKPWYSSKYAKNHKNPITRTSLSTMIQPRPTQQVTLEKTKNHGGKVLGWKSLPRYWKLPWPRWPPSVNLTLLLPYFLPLFQGTELIPQPEHAFCRVLFLPQCFCYCLLGPAYRSRALLSKEREVQSAPQRRGGGHERPLCVLRITGRCAQGGQGQRTQEEWHELRSGVRAHHTHWETKPSDFERNCKPSLGASNWVSR